MAKTNNLKKPEFKKVGNISDEIFDKLIFNNHPHADDIRISDPFLASDKMIGTKTARIYHYTLGMNAPHKTIEKDGYEVVSDDGLLLNDLDGYDLISPDEIV